MQHSLDLSTNATLGFTEALKALNRILESDAKGGDRNWRRDATLVLTGAAVAGGGVTGLLKFLG